MDLHLSGKTALVSGSSSGIGAAIARTLAAEGVSVVVHGRHEERLHAVASAITREGGKAYVAQGDLSTDEGANETIRATLAALGGAPDILVNNAGGGDEDTLQTWQSSLASWRGLIEHNLFGALRLTLQLLPKLRDQTWGRIINVASG
ncbi:MAG: SDR family oxidoreductase, partial [Polyangiales bacterium]